MQLILAFAIATLFLAACGTDPGARVQFDVGDGMDVATGDANPANDDVETTDGTPVSDGAPVDALGDADARVPDASSNDVTDDGPPDTAIDVFDGDIEAGCESVVIRCTHDSSPVDSVVTLSLDDAAPVMCEVVGSPADLVTWTWAFGEREATALETLPTTSTLRFVPARIGEGRIGAYVGVCSVTGPAIRITPPGSQFFIILSWTSDATTVERSVDADLHVLRDPGLCWFDARDDLHFGSETTLDWGLSGDSSDDIRRGADSRRDDRIEFAIAGGRPASETWTAAVDVRSMGNATVARVSLDLFLEGELLLSREATFGQPGWWTVVEISAADLNPVNQRLDAAPECAEPCGVETCNGSDDDCDGLVDEDPQACLNQEGIDDLACSYIAEADEYRCTEL